MCVCVRHHLLELEWSGASAPNLSFFYPSLRIVCHLTGPDFSLDHSKNSLENLDVVFSHLPLMFSQALQKPEPIRSFSVQWNLCACVSACSSHVHSCTHTWPKKVPDILWQSSITVAKALSHLSGEYSVCVWECVCARVCLFLCIYLCEN